MQYQAWLQAVVSLGCLTLAYRANVFPRSFTVEQRIKEKYKLWMFGTEMSPAPDAGQSPNSALALSNMLSKPTKLHYFLRLYHGYIHLTIFTH